MSSTQEFEGKAIEEALEKASRQLNVPVESIRYEVISYGSTGIFGIVGAKKARIRVVLNDTEETNASDIVSEVLGGYAKKVGHRNKKAAKKPQKHHTETTSNSDLKPKQEKETKPDFSAPQEDKSPVQETDHVAHVPTDPVPETENISVEATPANIETAPSQNETIPEKTEQETVSSPEPAPITMEALVETGRDTLQRIVDGITDSANVSVSTNGDRVRFEISGGNTAVLIGKRGQTLDAIQYIVEKVINRHMNDRVRVLVDVEGYLENRRSNLESLAGRLAEKAKRTGKPVTIGQMNAHDRRIIHMALRDDNFVRTQSLGNGFYRKLMIFPKGHSHKRKRQE